MMMFDANQLVNIAVALTRELAGTVFYVVATIYLIRELRREK